VGEQDGRMPDRTSQTRTQETMWGSSG